MELQSAKAPSKVLVLQATEAPQQRALSHEQRACLWSGCNSRFGVGGERHQRTAWRLGHARPKARSHNPITLPQDRSGFVVSITLQVPEMW